MIVAKVVIVFYNVTSFHNRRWYNDCSDGRNRRFDSEKVWAVGLSSAPTSDNQQKRQQQHTSGNSNDNEYHEYIYIYIYKDIYGM